jgi:hypothetical protein
MMERSSASLNSSGPSLHLRSGKRPGSKHVICFFADAIQKVISECDARMVVENRWEDGPHPLYEIRHQGQRLAFYHPGVGAALVASLIAVESIVGRLAIVIKAVKILEHVCCNFCQGVLRHTNSNK